MTLKSSLLIQDAEAINRGFSKQSADYDETDRNNPVLQDLRNQVYHHVKKFLRPSSRVLELNAGTGLDAMHFVSQGHRVHATDISDGMIREIKNKIQHYSLDHNLTCEQLSYTDIERSSEKNFDFVFSNFGGLNCVKDLSQVTTRLPALLNDGACVSFVIMPPVSLWELSWFLKADVKKALRRLHNDGTIAHVEGEYFKTYYHSLRKIRKSFPASSFRFITSESLGIVSPPPHCSTFPVKHPTLYKFLRRSDQLIRNTYPFNRWGDHLITTFQFKRNL